MTTKAIPLLDAGILRQAALDAFAKLAPAKLVRNPVMFVTEVVALLVTLLFVRDLVTGRGGLLFSGQIAAWLWFTVLFANFAEAIAEGRGKAQADALRSTRSDTQAKLLLHPDDPKDDLWEPKAADLLEVGDVVLVEAGDTIPADGEVIEGIASVNEFAVTGESAPVIRESGGDRSAVTGGTVVHLRLDQGARHGRARLVVPRPDDRAGRRRGAAEDAERAGALDPALRHDADLPDRGRDAVGPRRLLRHGAVDHGAGRAARHAHPDDHRRPAVGDRHRRHGSADPLQRDGNLGPRRRSGGRRRYAAARQDRHHHLRQPPGDGLHSRARRHGSRGRRRPRCCPRSPTRRRRAARSSRWPKGSTARASRSLRS